MTNFTLSEESRRVLYQVGWRSKRDNFALVLAWREILWQSDGWAVFPAA